MTINGVLQQFASYDLMIYKPLAMIEEIQTFMTLCDGDIIMSGTPKGVGGYKVGDIFEAKVFDKNELLVTAHFCAK
jgi:2-keto-4-pentenoate hydratase/2-oxohepta-3-ene-1,7-dioic acid hydratase in catechol pathway